ncbi:hypothetical protein M9435_004658 [Picochlorum sp. BPE23]|nr:hypothetical protein M9435_004658 [Picochlorum sp. BPE23]
MRKRKKKTSILGKSKGNGSFPNSTSGGGSLTSGGKGGVPTPGKKVKKQRSASYTSHKGSSVSKVGKSSEGRSRSHQYTLAQSDILRQAAYAVGRLVEADATGKHGVSLKSLTLGKNVRQKKAVYAVTVETLKYYRVLKSLVDEVFGGDLGGMSEATLCVLVREIVLGDGISRIGRAERLVLEKEEELKRELSNLVEQSGVQSVSDMLPQNELMVAAAKRKRTLRVNLAKVSVEEVKNQLMEEFQSVSISEHLPDVIELDPGSDLHSHTLVRSGNVVLQSLASCIPASVLDPEPHWHVIDACAAPGNKTTHLAAIMSHKATGTSDVRGKVFAFDKDTRRLEILKKNVALTGTTSIIEPSCRDFLEADPGEFARVDAILLDPSCSGSGTAVSRMDYLLPNSSQHVSQRGVMHVDERVLSLKQFQISVIQHAMSFPNVKKIVYSTCSIYYEENEGVIADVLEFAKEHGFHVAEVLPSWPRRGLVLQQEERQEDILPAGEARKVLRVDPIEDGTDGFFVAMFVK